MSDVDTHQRRAVSRIARVRKSRKMTQKELAEAAGMTRDAVCAVESGRRGLMLGEAFAMCEALDLDLGAVVARDPLVLRTVDEQQFD